MYNKGQIVGKYQIIERVSKFAPHKYLAKCNDCGDILEKWYNAFNGCKNCKARNRKAIDRGDYIELELTGGEYTKIDKEDYELIRNNCWYKSIRNSVETRGKEKLIKLHRLIMGNPVGIIDHINGDVLDNRKANLRVCTTQQNNMNKKACVTSKSGIKGVRFDKRKSKYCVQITLNKKRYSGGMFLNLEDAIKSVNKLTLKLHGEYAKQY